MSDGAYAKVGAKLIERGYSAIPIMPQTKRPGELRRGEWVGKSNWREEYTRRLPSRFEVQIWSASDAGVCVVCGPASQHLVGVDIDTDDAAIRGGIIAALPPTTLIKRGKKGETRFYRAPSITKSKSWNIPCEGQEHLPWRDKKKFRACDLIGPGRQTLLPPTIHPETKEPYVWIGPDALEDTDANDIPELTQEHIDAISSALGRQGFEDEPEPEPVERGGRYERSNNPDIPVHRRLNDEAISNYDKWVPALGLKRWRKTPGGFEAVAEWRASGTGQSFEKRKYNLKFHRDGIQDFGDGPRPYTPLNVVMAAFDLRDSHGLDIAFGWLSGTLGWNDDAPIMLKVHAAPSDSVSTIEVRPEPVAMLPAEAKGGELVAPNSGAIVEPTKADAMEANTRPPGLIGDIVDWIEATARRPNRVMGLGVAVTVLGTLMGRRIAGPTRSATHLYISCLAPTGSGKQHPLDCLAMLLRSAKAGHLVGPSEFISMPAVINMLQRQPLCLSAQDEFGAFLKRINGRNASSFEKGVSKIMRSVWGISFSEYMTPEWAGRAASPVFSPALSIFGVSTPDEFYDGLQGSELTNGFLNRFLVLKANRTDAVVPASEPGKVPEGIALALGEVFRWGADENSLATSRVTDSTMQPDPVALRWANSAATKCFQELEKHIEEIITKEFEMSYYIGRTAEIAIRLATIRAVGRWGPYGEGPTVDLSDVEWGRDIAMQCGMTLAKEAKMYMAENERQAWSNRILDVIRKRGSASPRAIQQNIRGAMKSAEIKDILDGLCESGVIEAVRDQNAGRLMTVAYKYTGE